LTRKHIDHISHRQSIKKYRQDEIQLQQHQAKIKSTESTERLQKDCRKIAERLQESVAMLNTMLNSSEAFSEVLDSDKIFSRVIRFFFLSI
jgi:hypothetical protein